MKYDKPLESAVLLRRYKRFLADVELADGRQLTVHCPNSGSMTACCEPGRPVIISDSQNPKRKLRYTWEMIKMGRTWVGVHSALANNIVAHHAQKGAVPELAGYGQLRREVAYGREGRSRVDLVLEEPGRRRCYVEIKHSTMRVGWDAAFPDAVTERGRKHLEDLAGVAQQGHRAMIFFLVGRNDCRRFRPADEIDSVYGQTLRTVVDEGVEAVAYRAAYGPAGVSLRTRLPIVL